MFMLFLSLVMLGSAVYLQFNPQKSPLFTKSIQAALLLIGLFGLISRSFVIVDSDEIGHLKRIYLADDLPAGQIIATNGEKGPQSEIIGPGFHLIFLVKILYDVEYYPVIEIPEGQYGLLVAKDGVPLRDNQFIADEWPQGQYKNMLDATYFLSQGRGQKGPQLDVLRPGKYRINYYLFDVKRFNSLDVPTGHVAVIRSNVQTVKNCEKVEFEAQTDGRVATPIVDKGCIGVWKEPLPPGRYYFNEKAYVPTIIQTRLQTWSYKGGYTSRRIDLTVDDNGTIKQKETSEPLAVPANAADRAILVRVEGWTVPIEMRVIIQVHPKDAPVVVATVGDLKRVEDNVITPAIRDILRTIGGEEKRKVLDFISKRDEITQLVEDAIAKEGYKSGVSIQEVRMGEPAIPPELMVATLREQLATQLKETYIKEKAAQKQRIAVERERATANQQAELVKAEIAKQAASFKKGQLQLEGEGEKLKLMEIARGQKAQADVLGKDRAMQLQALEKALDAATKNPQIVKVPTVQVQGSQGGFEGAAAILGASNIIKMMQGLEGDKKKQRK